MFKRADGIVDFDKSICIGCKACMAACPYDAIFINPEDHSAEKCNFCAHRIDVGLEPACVVVCPTQAILIGDMNDQTSYVAQIVNREPVNVRRPEKETLPKLFYKGAHQATLDPLAAQRPEAGLFMWSEQQQSVEHVVSGNPTYNNTSAAALLSYDVAHSIPWDWRVSLYTWTKGIASGVYLVAALLFLFGFMQPNDPAWLWVTPIVSGAFLGVTGLLLIWDLEHPARFYMIFTRAQWRSWLVKGAFIIAGYSVVLALHFMSSLLGWPSLQKWLVLPGIPLSALTAIYTAYLFAQAKARDMWQSPLLPPHLMVQALLLGAICFCIFLTLGVSNPTDSVFWIFAIGVPFHLLCVFGEITLTHPTTHARLAVYEMVRGRYRLWFWMGIALNCVAIVALSLIALERAQLIPVTAAIHYLLWASIGLAAVGILFHEHAYVQAGQSVPLA
jgi:ferredoxin/predicted membrane protein